MQSSNLQARVLVIVPEPPRRGFSTSAGNPAGIKRENSPARRPDNLDDCDIQMRLAEATGLTRALPVELVDVLPVFLRRIDPATCITTGKLQDIAAQVLAKNVSLVVIHFALSPVQQRNLERALKAKVLDRTGLILEIFSARARSAEGRLQVELAHLIYQKSRLVRSWTHLERQRGGLGFIGGPGETQIEADRRHIATRIAHIRRDLERVRSTRAAHRKARKRRRIPVIALVGYTNAGKSTLFNRLCAQNVTARNQMFSTLDTTSRKIILPSGMEAILSDTVGFISNLPAELIAAFRATLEEITEADLIFHVRDMTSPHTRTQAHHVRRVLRDIGAASRPGEAQACREIWNKADLLSSHQLCKLQAEIAQSADTGNRNAPLLISARDNSGIGDLQDAIMRHLCATYTAYTVEITAKEAGSLNWLYEVCQVIGRRDDSRTGRVSLQLLVPASARKALHNRYANAVTDSNAEEPGERGGRGAISAEKSTPTRPRPYQPQLP